MNRLLTKTFKTVAMYINIAFVTTTTTFENNIVAQTSLPWGLLPMMMTSNEVRLCLSFSLFCSSYYVFRNASFKHARMDPRSVHWQETSPQ